MFARPTPPTKSLLPFHKPATDPRRRTRSFVLASLRALHLDPGSGPTRAEGQGEGKKKDQGRDLTRPANMGV